jgi:polyhydroxybutyrate depolymerase
VVLVKLRTIILGAVAILVALPMVALLVGVVWISVLDRSTAAIVSSGEEREYLLYVPESYDPGRPTPLVISLHAGATWPAHQKNLTGWNRLADEKGFIVVYPAGEKAPVPRIWHSFETGEGLDRDVRFISELIDRLESEYAIDASRVYADGMSNGGAMASVLACVLSDRIAAVGLVAAAQSLPADWCQAARPVPMMAFHGTDDRIVPYDGGALGDPFNPVTQDFAAVREWAAAWARRNGCGDTPSETNVAADVVRTEYPDCAGEASVVLYTLLGGGHSWPGGKPPPEWRVGATNTSVDATTTLWEFYEAHPMPER